MPDGTIDLGEVTSAGRPAAAPAPLWPPVRRSSARRALLVVVAVLVAATMTASAQRRPPSPATVIPLTAGAVTFVGRGQYFVVDDTGGVGEGQVQNKIIKVYALPSAAPVSRTAVTVTGPILNIVAVDGLILVSYQSDGGGNVATAAYAAGTERTLWRRYGQLLGLAPSGRVALLVETTAGTGPPRWYGADVRTGRVGWQAQQQLEDAASIVRGAGWDVAKLVSVTPAGRIEVRDTDDGRLTATATVPAPAAGAAELQVWVAGELLLIGGGRPGTSAYELSDLRPRWRSRLELSGWSVQPDCGEVICLIGFSGGVRAIDPTTGLQRWTADRWAGVERIGASLVATAAPFTPIGASSGSTPHVVLDMATGRERGTLSPWRVAGRTRPDGSVPVVRQEASSRRAYFGLLRPDTLAVRGIGVAERVSGDCVSTADVLICRRGDTEAGVWPYRLP